MNEISVTVVSAQTSRKVLGMATSAMIIGSLPFIMLAIISAMNWDYASVLFHDPRARIALGGGVVWMGIGMGIIAKLISFEI